MAVSKPILAQAAPQPTAAEINFFWSRVNKTDGCWEWTGPTDPNYGNFRYFGKFTKAHRYSWVLHSGEPIPAGLFVCHKCDNPKCVRPSHLFLGTHTDNMRDCANKGRNASQSHPENVARGNEVNTAKLTEEDVRFIRESRGKISQIKLAEMLGVVKSTIWNIQTYRTWSHV